MNHMKRQKDRTLKDDAVESAALNMQYAPNMQYAGSRQHRNPECQVHESRQIGSGQTGDGKSERRHARNQQTKMDWNE